MFYKIRAQTFAVDNSPFILLEIYIAEPGFSQNNLFPPGTHFPSWNSLPPDIQNSSTTSAFKNAINKNAPKTPPYYYTGNRENSVQHTRLRVHCSTLKQHLYSKKIIDASSCMCGEIEDTEHFHIHRLFYKIQRAAILRSLSHIQLVNSETFRFGKDSLDTKTNSSIFTHVQNYISQTELFKR